MALVPKVQLDSFYAHPKLFFIAVLGSEALLKGCYARVFVVDISAVVSIHADFQEKEDEEEAKGHVNQMEEEVVDSITHLLANRSPADSSRIWELVQLRLVGVQVGRSVVLFFHCQTVSDLDELHRSYISGDLRQKVEMVFHRLLLRETQV